MPGGVSGFGKQYSLKIQTEENAALSSGSASVCSASASGVSGISNSSGSDNKVGNGTWNTQTILDAGLDVQSKYFIGLYKRDLFRFNAELILKDFPGQSIQTLDDLKKAIELKKSKEPQGSVGNGSWNTEKIQEAGINLDKYKKYFIGVYTNYYRFNPETIKQDFPGKSIQSLSDLKSAIDNFERDNSELYLKSIKIKLKRNYGYSDNYIEVFMKFLKQKINSESANSAIENFTDYIDKIIGELTGETNLAGDDYNHEQHVYKLDSLFKEDYTSLSLQNEFFAFMISDSCEFENDRDRDVFMHKIFADASKIIGKWSKAYLHSFTLHENDTHFRISDLIDLDKNGDGNWLNEFYDIISTNAQKINNASNTKNLQSIDADALFGDNDALTPENLSQMLDSMLFSDDAGVVKLRSMIYKAIDRFNIDNYYDETEIITDIIKLLNGTNTKPVKLTKETFEKLNNGTIFETLGNIINGDDLYNMYYYDVDNELDICAEGRKAGNCWAIAALTSLSSSEEGRKKIRQAMTFNEDGSVTVTFKGVENGPYTITKTDMLYYKNLSDGLSYGDNTMLVLLAAAERLRIDLGYHGSDDTGLKINDPGYYNVYGNQNDMIKWITGNSEVNFSRSLFDVADDIYNNIDDENFKAYLKYYAITHDELNSSTDVIKHFLEESGYDSLEKNYSKNEQFNLMKSGLLSGDVIMNITSYRTSFTIPLQPDGDPVRFDVGNHAWGVKEITDSTVTFWDLYGQTEYTVNIDDLLASPLRLSYTIVNDDYKLPEELEDLQKPTSVDIDLKRLSGYTDGDINRDKTQFNSVVVDGSGMTIDEILNSAYSPLLDYEFSPDDNYFSMFEKVYCKIENVFIQIFSNMPGYTDYKSLTTAFNILRADLNKLYTFEVNEKFQKVESLIKAGKDQYSALQMSGLEYLNIDIKSLFEKFLSYLPGYSKTISDKILFTYDK